MSKAKPEFLLKDQTNPGGFDDIDPFPVIATKLYRPPVTPDLEQRQRLLEQLERRRQRPLTLISAPAGYGKTMLASLWLETCGCSSAWISLDEGDNDLITFLSYLLAAINKIFPHIELKTQSLLHTPTPHPVPLLARYLLQDLDQVPEPFILVLDDIHRIDATPIFELLDELLQHPPRALHLVLIGRHDPPLQIASLRARSQVSEIRTQSLRFSAQETAGLLGHMLNREISEAIAAEWARSTEGWVTALRLAALSLSHRGQEEDLSLPIRGDSRYLRDFLLAEVLARLPKEFQDWLIKSAILERFCAPLCEAVCGTDQGQPGLSGKSFIDWLEGENLFLIPLDDHSEWFRFHHLFQEMLLHLLSASSSAEEIADLRMRASKWFAENNLFDEALKYALAAGDIQKAIHLVEQYRYQLINVERWNELSRWIGVFPDDMVDNDPILAITKAHLPSSYGQEVMRLRSRANQLVADLPAGSPIAQEVKGEIAYFDLLWGILTGPAAVVIEQANVALTLFPQQAEYFRSAAIAIKALGLQMSGDYRRGVNLINNTLAETEWSANARAKLLMLKSYIFFFESDLIAAQKSASESLKIASKLQLWHTIGEAHYLAGISHYLRNELDMAEAHMLFLINNRLFCTSVFVAQGVCALARLYRTQRQPEKASEVFDLVFSHLEELESTFALDMLRAFQIELALDQGDLDLTHRLSQLVDFDMGRPVWYHYTLQLTQIKLWLVERRAKSLEKAGTALESLNQQLLGMNRKPQTIDVLALQALVHEAQGDLQMAAKRLMTALRLGESGGFIRSFTDLGTPMASLLLRMKEQEPDNEYADYVAQILDAFADDQLPKPVAAHEFLTDREFEVLSLLAKQLSNREIAKQLVISLSTVKSHTLNIYNKLGVNNRKQAVEKAVELGILSRDRTA